jgi:hypothetical protein
VLPLATFALGSSAHAQDPPPVPAATPQQTDAARQFEALKKKLDDASKAFNEAYTQAKDKETRQKVIDEKYPKRADYAAEARKIAAAAPKDPIAADCLIFAIDNGLPAAEADEVLATLQQDHLQHRDLDKVCRSLVYSRSRHAIPFLEAVLAKNPHPQAQGFACYTLAKVLASRADLKRRASQDAELATRLEKSYGKEGVAEILASDPEALTKRATALFEQTAAKYSDVVLYRTKTLAQAAQGDLFEMRNLQVGMVAPEIEGTDLEGQKFKLSDYRGKVVFLDFWGFW